MSPPSSGQPEAHDRASPTLRLVVLYPAAEREGHCFQAVCVVEVTELNARET